MENYKYKFKPKERFKRRLNRSLSDVIFWLYKSQIFQKLNFDKNELIKYHAAREEKIYKLTNKIPKKPDIIPYSITLYDIINFEDLIDRKSELIKLLSKFGSGPLGRDPEREINETLDQIKDNYKSQYSGSIGYVSLKKQKKFELINGINFGYLSGEQSHIILIYTIFPSEKFVDLFHYVLNEPVRGTKEIIFNSVKNILRGKQWVSSIKTKPEYPDEKLKRIVKDLVYEFKSEFLNKFSLGLFNQSNKNLFPTIITYKYNVENTKDYLDEFFDRINCHSWELYAKDGKIINFHFLKKYIQIFIPQAENISKEKPSFQTVENLSPIYTNSLAPYWTSLKITEYHQLVYVGIRKRTFKYLRQNKDSLFLSRAIALKKEINLHFWKFQRIINDFSHTKFPYQLSNLPELKNKPIIPTHDPGDLKGDLIKITTSTAEDLLESYSDLEGTFKRISDDNLIKANMNLQRILISLGLVGALLTIYGANSVYFNSKIKSFLELLTSI